MANGDLSLKDAYSLKSPVGQNTHWSKFIWSRDIPPSKSLLSWRLMHGRIPTDDNLQIRGCNVPSICSNCFKEVETSFHLFLNVLLQSISGIGSQVFLIFPFISQMWRTYGRFVIKIGPLNVRWLCKLALLMLLVPFGLEGTRLGFKTNSSIGKLF